MQRPSGSALFVLGLATSFLVPSLLEAQDVAYIQSIDVWIVKEAFGIRFCVSR